jgi:membrane protease YdiL (CAAX protease family)
VDNPRRHLGVVLPVVTYLCVWAFWTLSNRTSAAFEGATLEGATKLAMWGVACVATTMATLRCRAPAALAQLGLLAPNMRGVRLVLLATIPMAFVAIPGLRGVNADHILGDALLGPLAEEVLFRGFLFGLLVQVARWRLSTAIAFSAVGFGLAHDGNLAESVALAAGGAVMAWIVYRWRSLWPAIAFHGAMNFWWVISESERIRPAFLPDLLSVAQISSVVLALGLTARATRGGD